MTRLPEYLAETPIEENVSITTNGGRTISINKTEKTIKTR